MSKPVIKQMLEELDFWKPSSNEVFEFNATALIDDFKVPASFVVDMMHELRAAVANEYGD